MKNRLDLEQDIMDCWNITKELEHVASYVAHSNFNEDNQQRIVTLLTGLRELYEIKFAHCFDTFEKCLHNKEI